jgi:hypothetical protein
VQQQQQQHALRGIGATKRNVHRPWERVRLLEVGRSFLSKS